MNIVKIFKIQIPLFIIFLIIPVFVRSQYTTLNNRIPGELVLIAKGRIFGESIYGTYKPPVEGNCAFYLPGFILDPQNGYQPFFSKPMLVLVVDKLQMVLDADLLYFDEQTGIMYLSELIHIPYKSDFITLDLFSLDDLPRQIKISKSILNDATEPGIEYAGNLQFALITICLIYDFPVIKPGTEISGINGYSFPATPGHIMNEDSEYNLSVPIKLKKVEISSIAQDLFRVISHTLYAVKLLGLTDSEEDLTEQLLIWRLLSGYKKKEFEKDTERTFASLTNSDLNDISHSNQKLMKDSTDRLWDNMENAYNTFMVIYKK